MSITIKFKNGKKVPSSKYFLNEETKTLSVEIDDIVVDSNDKNGLYGWRINVKDYSIVKVMYGCTVYTKNHCTVEACSDNYIYTENNCTIHAVNRNKIVTTSYSRIYAGMTNDIICKHSNTIDASMENCIRGTIQNIITCQGASTIDVEDSNNIICDNSTVYAGSFSVIKAKGECKIHARNDSVLIITNNMLKLFPEEAVLIANKGFYDTRIDNNVSRIVPE